VKRIARLTVAIILLMLVFSVPALAQKGKENLTIILFWRDGCPFCLQEKEFLDELKEDYPELEILLYNVHDPDSREVWEAKAEEFGVKPQYVPHTFIGNQHWVGFATHIKVEIQQVVEDFYQDRERQEHNSWIYGIFALVAASLMIFAYLD
jgi:thiol-disulfide isomerase/thioredoxin